MQKNKLLTAALIIAFVVIAAVVMYRNTQLDSQANTFMSQGARFTARDGQALCERVAALETIGGIHPLPCHYPREQ